MFHYYRLGPQSLFWEFRIFLCILFKSKDEIKCHLVMEEDASFWFKVWKTCLRTHIYWWLYFHSTAKWISNDIEHRRNAECNSEHRLQGSEGGELRWIRRCATIAHRSLHRRSDRCSGRWAYLVRLLPPVHVVCGKVMFSFVSVCQSVHGSLQVVHLGPHSTHIRTPSETLWKPGPILFNRLCCPAWIEYNE